MEPAATHLESCVGEGIDEYRRKSEFSFPGSLSLTLYPTGTAFTESRPGNSGEPIVLEEKGDALVLHLCRELLRPVPERAIKGWLHHVLAHYQLSQQRAFSPFNFSREILPLFPVSGSAVNLVRQIVERLKNGLEAFLTIRWIVAIGLGEEQVSLFSYRLKILAEGMEPYQLAIPHPWIRAACLSGFLQLFLAVTCLDGQELSACPGVEGPVVETAHSSPPGRPGLAGRDGPGAPGKRVAPVSRLAGRTFSIDAFQPFVRSDKRNLHWDLALIRK